MSQLDQNNTTENKAEKLSVFIIAKNEEDRIACVIKAVKPIADEILVIDSGSSDNTCDVAMKMGAKVIYNEWHGYGPQKVFGESQCNNDWILNIDADEEVSKELVEEIKWIFDNKEYKNYYGYKVKIVNKFRFEDKSKKLAYFYNQFRLYNKNYAGFKDSSIHDSVELKQGDKSNIGQLNDVIYHQSFRSFEHWIYKINSYSSMQAKDSLEKGKNVSAIKTLFSPVVAFFKAYIIRRYFIYGFDGFVYSYLFAFSRFAKAIKIREAFRAKRIEK